MGRLVPQIQKVIGHEEPEIKLNIANFIIAVMTEVLKRTFWKFTSNCNIHEKYRPIINMKNELIPWLHYAVMHNANPSLCWNRKESAASIY